MEGILAPPGDLETIVGRRERAPTSPDPIMSLTAVGKNFTRMFDQYSVICVFGSVVGCVVMPWITQVKADDGAELVVPHGTTR